MSDFQRYIPISKVDDDQRMVWGYASTPALDLDDEIVKLSAIHDALPDYMEWANIREMHQPSAVGTAVEATVDQKGLWLGAHIVDDGAWLKVKKKVYKGFSIGGAVTKKVGNSIESLRLIEISLVDRPANPECRIEIVKAAEFVEHAEAELVKIEKLREMIDSEKEFEMTTSVMLDKDESTFIGRLLKKFLGGPVSAIELIPVTLTTQGGPDENMAEIPALAAPITVTGELDPTSDEPAGEPEEISEPDDRASEMFRMLQELLNSTADAQGSMVAGKGASTTGEDDMTTENAAELAKRASAAARDHLGKAASHLVKAASCHGAAMGPMRELAAMLKESAAKAAGGFDAAKALDCVHKSIASMDAMGDHQDVAAMHIGKAGGVADGTAAAFTGSHVSYISQPNEGAGGMPALDGISDASSKNATGSLTKEQHEQIVAAEVKAAKAEGELEALRRLPAGARKGAVFDASQSISQSISGGGAAPNAFELLTKGVNLGAETPDERKNGAAKMIANMIGNSEVFGKNPILDPNFRGLAG